jgi:hypothetical protein
MLLAAFALPCAAAVALALVGAAGRGREHVVQPIGAGSGLIPRAGLGRAAEPGRLRSR